VIRQRSDPENVLMEGWVSADRLLRPPGASSHRLSPVPIAIRSLRWRQTFSLLGRTDGLLCMCKPGELGHAAAGHSAVGLTEGLAHGDSALSGRTASKIGPHLGLLLPVSQEPCRSAHLTHSYQYVVCRLQDDTGITGVSQVRKTSRFLDRWI
jgi:hypothetical protein